MGTCCIAQGTHLVHCGNLNGREVQKGGDICMCMADSLCCAVEANTTLWSNHTPIKINLKKKKEEIVPEEGQAWGLLDKNLKSTILNMFKELK